MSTDKMKQRRDDEFRLDIENAMATESGRRLVWAILEQCGVYRDIEEGAEDVGRRLGRRSVGLWLLAQTSLVSEDEVFTMMKEARFRAQEEKDYYDNEDAKRKQSDEPDTRGYASGLRSGAIYAGGSEYDYGDPTGGTEALGDLF